MIFGLFLAICGAGALLGITLQSSERAARLVNLLSLACAAGAAAALGTGGQSLTIGDVQLATTAYSAAFLTIAAASCLLLCVVGVAAHPADAVGRLAPAALAAIGGFGVAFTSGDPRVSLMAGTAAAAAGTLTILHRPAGPQPDGRVAELRILALTGGALLLAAIVVMRPSWTGPQDRAFGAAFLALALAIAVRGGAIPFHIPTSNLARNATPLAMALLSIFLPAGLGALALTWSPIAFDASASWMGFGIGAVQVVAIATILLGALAALVHDRLEEVVAYSIISDAGFILAALAARSEAAAEPARLWLLVFVAGKTALVAWAAATGRAFATSELRSLRGWLRRTPLLGLCLIAIAVATIGWPGSGAATARADIVRLGLPAGLGFVGDVAIVLSAAYYLRLLFFGLLRPTQTVRESWSERPRLGFSLRPPKRTVRAPAPAVGEPAFAVVAVAEVVGAEATEGAPADVTSEPAAAAAVEPLPLAAPKGRRRSKTAAAEEQAPSVSAEPPAEAEGPANPAQVEAPAGADMAAAAIATDATPEAVAEPKKLVLPRSRHTGPSFRHRLMLIWRLNRTLEVSVVVLGTAVLSLAVAAGQFGSANAAKAGLPLGTAAHATSSPTLGPSLAPTQAPLATGTPFVSAPPTAVSPTSSASSAATPGRTSAATSVIK